MYNSLQSSSYYSLLHILSLSSLSTADLLCRPEGPVVPRPRQLSVSPIFNSAVSNLTSTLDLALNNSINPGFSTDNVSFSVGVVSLAQSNPAVPLWEYHHLSAANTNGTTTLDRDSQWLIGSVSKVLSDAVLLKSGLDLDSSITDYLPELSKGESKIPWGNVTLGALAGQLSGIPPNYGFSEFYYLKTYFESLGFPAINDSAYASCGVTGLNNGCSKEDFIQGMLTVRPVATPWQRPVYSNIAFNLFVYAIEAATGMNYTEQLRHYLTESLGMGSTTVSPGFDNKAVIPPVENSWGSDYGDNAPGGGLVSTLSDLSVFFHALLARNATLLPSTAIEGWLKPHAFAGSAHALVGQPWEIFVPDPGTLTPAHPHTIPIFAKNGAAYGYIAQVGVVDELGIALVVLTAGDAGAYQVVYNAALKVVVEAVDEAARQEVAQLGFTGEYEGPCGMGSEKEEETVNGCFHVKVEQDADSLKLVAVQRNGSDILAAMQEIWAVTVGQFLPGPGLKGEFRIFPAEVSEPATLGTGSKVVREDWRIWWPIDAPGSGGGLSAAPGAAGFSAAQNCLGWATADWLYYGNESLDRIVFVREEETGKVVGLDVPFLRTGVLEIVAG